MALKVLGESIEHIWLANHERCDVVVCVTEKSNEGPASKKRISVLSDRGSSDTNRNAAKYSLHLGKKSIRLHACSDELVRSPYFETCLKETWCNRNGKEGSPVELPLETHVASSKAYQRCIEILCSSEPCTPHMFSQPLEALDIYLASDHLLFKECSAVCLEYLAAAPWSSTELKVISETFSTSDVKPSEDLVARLGLPKEECAQNLSKMLWHMYGEAYRADEYTHDNLPPGGSVRFNQFQNLISDLLRGLESKDCNNLRKTIILEFLHKAAENCAAELRDLTPSGADDWVYDYHFQGWLYMAELLMDISDGKIAVEVMALHESLQEMISDTFDNILAEHARYENAKLTAKEYRNVHIRSVYDIDLSDLMEMVRRVVMLVAEAFKRVAEMEVIVPEGRRNRLVTSWLPWLEMHHANEKICESVDMAALKVHLNKILQTLSMNDEDILEDLAEGFMNEEYFLEGALKAWFDRLV